MIIKSLTLNENAPTIVVRWTLDGVYDQGQDSTGNGVEVPDGAELIDIAFYGSHAFTQQIVIEPNWPGMLEVRNAA